MASRGAKEYGDGSVYQRHTADCPKPPKGSKVRPPHKCEGRWVAIVADVGNAGFTESGTRRRVTVTAKTEAAVRRKLRDGKAAHRAGQAVIARMTVKQWADEYLSIRVDELSPKGYNAAANPIRKWIVPTIGHKKLEQLTPRDVRAVRDAQRLAGRQSADTHRVLLTMLRKAAAEGHHVPSPVLAAKAPASEKSDRDSMSVEDGKRCLEVAGSMPRGSRWLFTLLYGARMGECLGLTRDSVDLGAGTFGEVVIEWQLQALPYNVPRDRSSGFRVPAGYEARHLIDAYHLVRPKSKSGWRVAPLLKPVRDALVVAMDTAPENPWGLVWPDSRGRPMNDHHDRAEWHALQAAAGVAHKTGRPYHVHECRNFAATALLEAGVDEHVVTALLGHSSVVTSRKYMTVRREPLLEAMTKVGERLQLG